MVNIISHWRNKLKPQSYARLHLWGRLRPKTVNNVVVRMRRSLEAHPQLWGQKVYWAAQQLLTQTHTEGTENSRKPGTAQIPTVCCKDKRGAATWWNIGQQQVESESLADKLLQSRYWQASSGRSRVVRFQSCEDPDQKRLERQRGMVVTWAGGGAGGGRGCSWPSSFFRVWWESPKVRLCWWLHNSECTENY